jgi:hypothetical protein
MGPNAGVGHAHVAPFHSSLDMLKKNLDLERGSEDGRSAARFWTEALRTLISSLAFITLFPAGLAAQAVSPTAMATPQATVYGSGVQSPLQFAGESAPVNQVSFSMGTSVLYDDNVFAIGSHGVGDEEFSFDSNIGISRQTERLTASFTYTPFFLFYRTFDQFDRLNHAGNLNLGYRLTSRVILGLHDSASYQTGNYASLTEQQLLSGPSSPTALNQVIIPYTTRTLSNMAGLDLTFAKSQRTSFTLSADYNQSKFGQQTAGQRLYNGNGLSGGLTFQYRVTAHTSFGILLLHQDSTYHGGQAFGNRLRTQVEGAGLSVGSRLSPTVGVTVFGGLEYLRLIGLVSPGVSLAGNSQPYGGGSITKQVRKTALDLSFQRSVSNGAGLYASAINTMASLGVRRRLVGRWEAALQAGAARIDTSLFQLANDKTDALNGGIAINRPVLRGSVFHISYFTWHQTSSGNLPNPYNLGRNQVAAGIDYQFKALPLGR